MCRLFYFLTTAVAGANKAAAGVSVQMLLFVLLLADFSSNFPSLADADIPLDFVR